MDVTDEDAVKELVEVSEDEEVHELVSEDEAVLLLLCVDDAVFVAVYTR